MTPAQAHDLVMSVLAERGTKSIIFTNRAAARMAQRSISENDVVDALRSGSVEPLQGKRDARFRVRDEDFCVVFATQDGAFVVVITAWSEGER